MDLFDLREPVSAWSHFAGLLLALPGTLLLWRRSGGDHRQAAEPARLRPEPGLLLCGQHPLPWPPHPDGSARRLRPPGPHRDLRPDRRQLHPAGLEPDAGPVAVGHPGDRLVDRRRRLGTAGDRRPLPAAGDDRPLPGDGVGRPSPATPNWHGSPRTVPCGPSSPVACLYSVGAVLNLLRWPALWPGLFGAHELFHLFVLAGSLAHYRLMLRVVVPFEPGPHRRPAAPCGVVEPEIASRSRPSPVCTPTVSGR